MHTVSIDQGSRAFPPRRLSLALLLILGAAGCAHKNQPAPVAVATAPAATTPAPAAADSGPRPVMDSQAMDLLKRMGDTLAAAKSFSYKSRSSAEVPASTGQFLTFFGHNDIAVARPNKLRAVVGGDVPAFRLVYDGAKVWAVDPGKNLYAGMAAPDSIDATLRLLMSKSGIEFPAADFLASDPYAELSRGVVSAFIVGPSEVDGHPTQHLAFMGPGVNWEIWIDSGREALPRRFAITYKESTNFPRFLVEFFDWRLNPKLDAGEFSFKPPKGAKQIEFATEVGGEFKAPAAGGK